MKFTVLLPTFDNGAVIRSAIDSVLEQTCDVFELFVVCDGSPPETHAIVDDAAARDARVRAFKFEKGERHGEAWRHKALEEAAGEGVCYLCDDDFWFPDHLAVMSKLLAGADFAHTRETVLEPTFRVRSSANTMTKAATRKRMLQRKYNFMGPTVAGHRLKAYRRLPVGWSPAPDDIWTDLHMWRKFIAVEGMRFVSAMEVTSLHLARSKRPNQDPVTALGENACWRAAFRDPHMRAALRELIPQDEGEVQLAAIIARAAGLRAADATERINRARTEERARTELAERTYAELQKETARLNRAQAEERARAELAERACAELQKEVEAHQAELRSVFNSHTWRYTKPLRDVANWLRGRTP